MFGIVNFSKRLLKPRIYYKGGLHWALVFLFIVCAECVLGNNLTEGEEMFANNELAGPSTQLILEAQITIADAVVVGDSDAGERLYIPITGGQFKGRGIQGEVMAGGADWQLVRPDGVREINAIYSLRTDDGAVIVVKNEGIVVADSETNATTLPYVRSSPKFHAPQGKYDWLNKKIFVGTISISKPGSVTIRVFEVL